MQGEISKLLDLQKKVLQINENNFEEIAWHVFEFQSAHNTLYRQYLAQLKRHHRAPNKLEKIPFLPIRFFKSHPVKTGNWRTERLFKSSGTKGDVRSAHHVWDESFYLHHAQTTFEKLFGPLHNFHVVCLLPSYDTAYSSLVAMARYLVAKSGSKDSGFFLDSKQKLPTIIEQLNKIDRKVLLLGVSHALLDLAEAGPFAFGDDILVMETGGMKGRKAELTRRELHQKLKVGLGVTRIVSEYGMTELLSQAYTTENETFQPASTMRVIIKELNDPFTSTQNAGIINIIDLANVHSCSFIETQDLGRTHSKGFEVLGRADNSEVRGCNLLIA